MFLTIKKFRLLIFALIALPLVCLHGCTKDYVTGKSSYNWYRESEDVKLGSQVLLDQMNTLQDENAQIDVDTEQVRRVSQIVDRIAKVSHRPDYPYEAHVAEVPVVNAWAAPGGKIMVYSGLYDPEKGLVSRENDDEIAAVLGHEIAHATARHVTESISRNMTIALVGAVASSAIYAAGSPVGSDLFGQAFNTGFNIYAPSYSRSNEAEADRIGLFYMAKAGYDPRAAVRVWKRAAQRKGENFTSIYDSHPSSGVRARTLEKYLPLAMEVYRDPSKPYPNFAELKKSGDRPVKKDKKAD